MPISTPLGSCDYRGQEEVLAAFQGLSQKEIERIVSFVRFRLTGYSTGYGHVEVEDLFMDAVIRTMQQKRKWKRGVDTFNHCVAVMRSLGNQRRKQAIRQMPASEVVSGSESRTLAKLDAQASVCRLLQRLRGDVVALSVLEAMMGEIRPKASQLSLGITARVYWAARKRIRRAAEDLIGAPRTRQSLKVGERSPLPDHTMNLRPRFPVAEPSVRQTYAQESLPAAIISGAVSTPASEGNL